MEKVQKKENNVNKPSSESFRTQNVHMLNSRPVVLIGMQAYLTHHRVCPAEVPD
jgi:hypothetical protein